MADVFQLGFDIDLTPLVGVKTAGAAAAAALSQLGDAQARVESSSSKATAATKALTEAQKQQQQAAAGAASATGAAGKANEDAAARARTAAESIQRMTGTLRMNQGEISSLIGLMRGQTGLVGGIEAASGAIGRMVGALGPLGIALGVTAAAVGAVAIGYNKLLVPLAEAQDRWQAMEARAKNALGSMSEARSALEAMYQSTQKTGLGFQTSADAFLRLARGGDRLGATTEQLLQLSDTVQKLGAVSGASGGEIGSGLLQLSQALASGKLNGDELRSIMENMPALAKAIADGLGVGVGQMRAMGASGELTSEKVFKAILKASERANQEFAAMPDTVERANRRVADSWEKLMGEMGEAWNASPMVRFGINQLAAGINGLRALVKPKTLAEQIQEAEGRLNNITSSPYRQSAFGNESAEAQARAELQALRAQAMRELRIAENAQFDADRKREMAPILSAAELGANEYDDFTKKAKKLNEDRQKIAKAIADLNSPTYSGTQAERDTLLPTLTRQLAVANAEAEGLVIGLAKVRKELSESQLAAKIGGGGGGTTIVTEALGKMRAERDKVGGSGSLQSYISLGIEQAAVKGGEQIASMDRQVQSQQRLMASIGATRAEVIELEVANEALQKRFDLFGGLNAPVGFMERYTAALRRSKQAADELANAQARLSMAREIEGLLLAGTTTDPFERRRMAAEQQAADMERQDPVRAAMMRARFGLQEGNQASDQIDALRRSAADASAMTGLSPADLRAAQLSMRIRDAQRGVAPDKRQELGDAMRAEDAARQTQEYAAQEAALERQLKAIAERSKLTGLDSEELRVQTKMLEKRQALEAAGVPQDVIDRQVALTELIERQAMAAEKASRPVNTMVRSFETAADQIGASLQSAIEVSLRKGSSAGLKSFSDSFSAMTAKMGAELTYEIGVRPFVEMMRQLAKMAAQKFVTWLFGFQGYGGRYADGAAFGPVGRMQFAAGGAFTNQIVDRPTLFSFANGTALGEMGEAGPEAIMPLRRGSDGSLGVAAHGGGSGVQVIVQDMRGGGGEPVQVSESRGPDGKRIVRLIIRDEVRRAMRSGELDNDMMGSFGVQRAVARR